MRSYPVVIGRAKALVIICLATSSCAAIDNYLPAKRVEEVEVTPGDFIQLERHDWTVDDRRNKSGTEKTRLRIPYRQVVINWEGADIPVVLRAKDTTLYMIGYDRETGRLRAYPRTFAVLNATIAN